MAWPSLSLDATKARLRDSETGVPDRRAGGSWCFDVNVFGAMAVTRAIRPHVRGRRFGIIINVSSGAGLYGLPMASAYCGSKFALEGFTEAVSYELSALGIVAKLVIPHGGVSGTGFPGPAGLATPAEPPSDYDEFVTSYGAAMARLPAPSLTPATKVAQEFYRVPTDGKDTLRYLVGNDTQGFMAARDSLSSDEYSSFMGERFGAI